MKKIITDSNIQQGILSHGNQAKHDKMLREQIKAQEDARTINEDKSDRVPQLKKKTFSVSDPNSSISEKVSATYPGQGDFDKSPTKMLQGILPGHRKEPSKVVHSDEHNAAISKAHSH